MEQVYEALVRVRVKVIRADSRGDAVRLVRQLAQNFRVMEIIGTDGVASVVSASVQLYEAPE